MQLSMAGLGEPELEGGEKRCLNSELWHACAGPLVCLPNVGTRVVYFPQGHSEQVAASTNKEVEGQIPNYPNLPPQLICQLHNVTMHADAETDEVYAQMTLQPLTPQEQKETYIPIEMGLASKQPMNYFCKTLTASDTSTHGGFSVPRRAAEKVFPPLDFSQQPPSQELIARDLHEVEWKFRHIFRGQPKRHLLTTGWSVFVSAKRLVAGDFVLFIWNEKNQLLLGIRRGNRPQTVMPSSVLSSDSMHIGLLAAAAHAASTSSRFTVFYNPRASPFEFVIPLPKYIKAAFHTRVSVGMRFRMLFETEESSVRRYMGTITGISDMDTVRWPNSHWRSVKVGWDESTAGERPPRVSLWEIEPVTTFPMYPSLFPLRLKRPWPPGLSSHEDESTALMWLRGDSRERGPQPMNFPSLTMGPWIPPRFEPYLSGNDHDQYQAIASPALQEFGGGDFQRQQFLQHQQPFLSSSLQHQSFQQNHTYNVQNRQFAETHIEQQKQQVEQPQAYGETFLIPSNHVLSHQSSLPSQLCQRFLIPDSSTNLPFSITPISAQAMLGSNYSEGSGSSLNFPRFGQPMMNNQNQQTWEPKLETSHGDPFGKNESCTADSQHQTLFGGSTDSSTLLPNTVPSSVSNAIGGEIPTMPYAASCIQNSLYGFLEGSSSFMQHAGEVDPTPRTFVKVYKSGSIGRSLDISQFGNYDELREELGKMFGIEGHLEDPFRSGWQLVFVDRENDVLLLGDDPWEQFVNSVSYIKILSPDDVQQMGKQ